VVHEVNGDCEGEEHDSDDQCETNEFPHGVVEKLGRVPSWNEPGTR